jgi:hypothetical protein
MNVDSKLDSYLCFCSDAKMRVSCCLFKARGDGENGFNQTKNWKGKDGEILFDICAKAAAMWSV